MISPTGKRNYPSKLLGHHDHFGVAPCSFSRRPAGSSQVGSLSFFSLFLHFLKNFSLEGLGALRQFAEFLRVCFYLRYV